MKKEQPAKSVEAYIASFPAPAQSALKKIRKTVLAAAPGTTEEISYGLPTVKRAGKVVIHYGAFQHHIGLYATPSGHAAFVDRLSAYKQGRGSVQFPLSEPMPLDLIRDIAAFRWAEVGVDRVGETKAKTTASSARKAGIQSGEAVTAHMASLPPAVRRAWAPVRKIILGAAPELEERIKWNAPSYHYNGVDILTFGPPHSKGVLLVIHHPSVVSVTSPLLTGTYKDRRLVRFASSKEAAEGGAELQRIIRDIMQLIDSITTKNKSHAKNSV